MPMVRTDLYDGCDAMLLAVGWTDVDALRLLRLTLASLNASKCLWSDSRREAFQLERVSID